MWMISWRNIRRHPGRYLSTALAIILGVSFFVGTSVLTSTVEGTLNNAIGEAFADLDASVRSTEAIEVGEFKIRSQIPLSLADEIAEIDGVDEAPRSTLHHGRLADLQGRGDVVR